MRQQPKISTAQGANILLDNGRRSLLKATVGATIPSWLLVGCGGGENDSSQQLETAQAVKGDLQIISQATTPALSLGVDVFTARRNKAMDYWRGKPLVLRYPAKGIGNYIRPVTYDYLSFALCGFFNNEKLDDIDGPNAAVLKHNALYKDNPILLDGENNFHWAIGLLFQCIEYFGVSGTVAPGRLSALAEADSLALVSQWVKSRSKIVDAKPGFSLVVHGSENLHIQDGYSKWHASKLLAASAAHQNIAYDDQSLPAAHKAAWAAWMEDWIVERTRHGLLIEYGGDAYNGTTMKVFYNVAAFARSAGQDRLGKLAEMFINVFWADWAQDHQVAVDATSGVAEVVRGGAKARVYPGHESLLGMPVKKWKHQQTNPLQQLVYFYTGLGSPDIPLEADVLQMVCSGVLPREEILNVFANSDSDKQKRESFVRVHGRFQRGKPRSPYFMLKDEGLVRYSYREQEFVMGSILCDARVELDWAMISSQNRWMGVVMSSHVNARVLFTCDATENERHYNAFWSVQKRGTLIAQRLPSTGGISGQMSKYAGATKLWVPRAGLVWQTERNGWVLLDYGTTRVGVFIVGSKASWVRDPDLALNGSWLVPTDENAAVVIEVVGRQRMRYSVFVDVMSRRRPVLTAEGLVTYKSLYGDNLELDTTCRKLPLINGSPINLKPDQAMNSPILTSSWGSARIDFTYGNNVLNFDFDAATVKSIGV